jgi:anhydro-N-acetylmuramic acid kinase
MRSSLFIGLMSGTSMDGVDGVLADFTDGPKVLAQASRPLPADLRLEMLALNQPGSNELHRAAQAAQALVRLYAQTVGDLLDQAKALGIQKSAITAIGAHGQTVRHQPERG